MNQYVRSISWWILVIVAIIVDLAVLSTIPSVQTVIRLSLVMIILATLFRGVLTGLVVAAIATLIWSLVSLVPWVIHGLAFIVTVLVVAMASQRLFAHRSSLSFMSVIALATFSYYLTMIIASVSVSGLDHSVIVSPWPSFIRPLIIQTVTHAIGAFVIWRWAGGGTFGTATVTRR